jgi:hypothetical protein
MTEYCNQCAEKIDEGDTVVRDHQGAYYHYDCWLDGGPPHKLNPHLYQEDDMPNPSTEHHSPQHYKKSIETIDAIRSWLGDDAFVQYCRGQVIRYASRLGDKDDSAVEARKIEVYARWMKETLEGKVLSK